LGNNANVIKSASRNGNPLGYVSATLGFRWGVNGVFRGGNWYQRPSYTRIVLRSGSEKRSYVLLSIGFRL